MLLANESGVALQKDFYRTAGTYRWIATLLLAAGACTPARRAWFRELLLTTPLSSLRLSEFESWAPAAADGGASGEHDEWCTMSEASTVPPDDDFVTRPLNSAEAASSWNRRHGRQNT